MKFIFGLMTAIMAQSNISFQSEMGLMNSMESEEGGTFDGGFDINDYVNEQTNPYFLELAHNISLANGGGANHRIRGAGRNELAPIDFAELQRKDAMMMTTTRKFKHVAGLVMFLQAVPILGKYVYYGCYCFSDAQYQLDAGHGKPVDAIDSACKRFHQCYACVKKDFVEEKQQANCDGTGRSYKFKGIVDPVTQQKQIVCLNEEGSCKRAICECDKKLAEELSGLEFKWNIVNHQRWGGFDKESQCSGFGQERSQKFSKPEPFGTGEQRCCGSYPKRFLYTHSGKDGSRRGCCRGQTFDLNGHLECCEGNNLVPVGTCLGETTIHESYGKSPFEV